MNLAKVATHTAISAYLVGCGQFHPAPYVRANSTVDPTFDTTAIQAAVDKGGIIQFAPGKYVIHSTIVVRKSGTVIQGHGPDTVIVFEPSLPQVTCVNDRAFTTPCDVIFTPRRQISAAIAIGDNTVSVSADLSDIHPGDWLIVDEDDAAVGGVPVAVDWAQVARVTTNMIYVVSPFRTAFSISRPFSDQKRTGTGFYKLPQLVENVEFRDFSIMVPDSGEGAPAISVFAAKDTVINNVVAQDDNGQALYSYISKGLTITNSWGDSGSILNEFGATVDMNFSNDTFISHQGAALGLDLGSAFFDISNISIPMSTDVGIYMIIGVHDGRLHDSEISYVTSSGNAVGILLRGSQRIAVTGNTLAGGAGSSIGISTASQIQNVDFPIPSSDITVTPNTFGSQWTTDID